MSKIKLKGKKFIADKLYDVIWLEDYLKTLGIKSIIKRKKNSLRKQPLEKDYKQRNEIEGLFGNIKTKLGGYVYAYREDMARILALLKFLIYNLYVAIFLFIVRKGYSKGIQKYFIIFLYLFCAFGLISYYF